MTREEELDELSRAVKSGPISQPEVLCPEMKAAARIPVDSVRMREKARRAVRKHQKNRSSVTAARACAARLMAPGAALAIPRLSRGSLNPFVLPALGRASCWLALCVRRGIGDAQDRQDSHGDAVQFMARTIERAAERFDRRAIDAVAHIRVSLGTKPVSSGWGDPEQDRSTD
jgi:hypothetical protein